MTLPQRWILKFMLVSYYYSLNRNGFKGHSRSFRWPNGLRLCFIFILSINWEDIVYFSIRKSVEFWKIRSLFLLQQIRFFRENKINKIKGLKYPETNKAVKTTWNYLDMMNDDSKVDSNRILWK